MGARLEPGGWGCTSVDGWRAEAGATLCLELEVATPMVACRVLSSAPISLEVALTRTRTLTLTRTRTLTLSLTLTLTLIFTLTLTLSLSLTLTLTLTRLRARCAEILRSR